jgi:hypothetical protein
MFWEWVSRRIWEDMPESGQFWILDTCARLVGEENVLIATSPTKSADCHAAKYHWIRDHIPDWCKRQYSITPRKWRLSMPGVLLIDDSDSNCLKFKNRPDGKPSGDAMIMPRPWNYSWQIGKSNLKTNAAVAERLGKLWTTKQH